MKRHDVELTEDALRRRIGNMDQVAGIRIVQLDDGDERPARAALFHTGSGLEFCVLLDRGMDIPSARYQGKAMGWRSTVGDVAPAYYEAAGIRWLRSYFGGLLTTCGLGNVGAPQPDSVMNGQGLHGRINHMPAKNIKVVQEWRGGEYVLSVSGVMRETVLFGENLTLTRTVSTKMGEKRFWIRDVVANEGFRDASLMLLYHCNIGWPALDAGSRILAPSRFVAPRDEEARNGAAQWNQIDPPTHGYVEKVYYHDMAAARDGSVTAAIVNNRFNGNAGFGVYVRYNKRQLPRFVEWKMMGEQDYVVGLEPCNCGVEGRQADESRGLLHWLAPGETRTFDLEFGAITAKEEVNSLRAACAGVKTKIVDNYTKFVKRPGK